VSFAWDFGQGSRPAEGRRIEGVAFPDSGVFTVILTARDDNGDKGKSMVVVEVMKNLPIASIIEPSSAREIFEGRAVRFAGQVSEGNSPFVFSWDFGGGAPPSDFREPGEVVFAKPGLYEVTFTVTDVHGDAHSAFTTVSVLQDTKPMVEILSPASSVSVLQGRGVEFLARVTGGDEPMEVCWDFQGAAPGISQLNPGLVTFPVPGTYQASFQVVDESGDTAVASVEVIVVEDTVPQASILDLPEEILITEQGKVLFCGAVSGGNEPLSCLWQFGGAAPDVQGQDAGEIAFTTVGVFPVRFTVTDADGDAATASLIVKVAEDTKPVASMEKPEDDVEIFEGEAVFFSGSARDGNLPLRYLWDFQGGARNVKVQNPGEVVFKKAGMYQVVFTVRDDNGDTDSVSRVVSVIRSSWASISGGWSHSAGLKTDGSLWTWGLNSYGQLGNGRSASCSTPAMVGRGTNWAKVAVGGAHTLALEKDGSLWAWGANGTGQLGNGGNQHAYAPVKIMPESRWKEITAGKSHSLGIQMDGSLWAWGRNAEGQLGDGTRASCNVPMPVGNDKDWRCAAAGEAHSIAVKEDGSLWSWGSNELGQVGDGGQSDSLSPKRIGTEDVWIAAAAGRWHTLAIRDDGSLWAWGANIWGQLGDGTKVYKVSPVRVGKDGDWKMVTAGEYHSLGMKTDGTLWSWGWNAFGQLGIGMTHDRRYPSCIGFDTNWSCISAGDHHSMAVKKNGTLWGWGYNGYGQVGDNTAEDRDAPVLLRPPRKRTLPFGISLPGAGEKK
jgi:alpha-tubulin suppressor-like RCC1 family protein